MKHPLDESTSWPTWYKHMERSVTFKFVKKNGNLSNKVNHDILVQMIPLKIVYLSSASDNRKKKLQRIWCFSAQFSSRCRYFPDWPNDIDLRDGLRMYWSFKRSRLVSCWIPQSLPIIGNRTLQVFCSI